MARGQKKAGLRVKHSASVMKNLDRRQKGMIIHRQPIPKGWFIWVRHAAKWQALLDLRFAREQDAIRAVASLTAAGLDCYNAMERAGVEVVKQVACTFLQW